MARLQSALFDWALHPKGHITTSTEKIAAYAEKQLQVRNGVLIGIGTKRNCRRSEKRSASSPVEMGSIGNLVT